VYKKYCNEKRSQLNIEKGMTKKRPYANPSHKTNKIILGTNLMSLFLNFTFSETIFSVSNAMPNLHDASLLKTLYYCYTNLMTNQTIEL